MNKMPKVYINRIQVLTHRNTFAIQLLPKGTANRGKNTIAGQELYKMTKCGKSGSRSESEGWRVKSEE